jgi:hypothetical protein
MMGDWTNIPAHGGASGTARIDNIDNSGPRRSLVLEQTLTKDRTVLGRKIEYKVKFKNATSDWKGGISRVRAGTSTGKSTDKYFAVNYAIGVEVRLCEDTPGPFNRCGRSVYIDGHQPDPDSEIAAQE